MKVLVTGASGLLGSRMLEVFPRQWDVTGTYCSRPRPGLEQLRLADSRSVRRVIADRGYDWVVHCAAIRSPELCAEDPRRAAQINSTAVESVARAASDAGARLAYASTDYVFAGDNPPYGERDSPSPVNVYGQSKLAGEGSALAAPGGLVVRMPALYSLDSSAPNNVLGVLNGYLRQGRQMGADEECVRYYTLAEEVAAAFAFLLGKGCRGIVHVSARQAGTKLEFLRRAARALGLDPDLVVSAERRPGAAGRPADSHLETTYYESLGGPPFTGYRDALDRPRAAQG